jgi:threonine/homoserine/homoserine lactone efflux protein
LLDLILKAVVTGFILSIMIGPVFFLLLETSIRKGVRSALAFDLGVLVSDIIYIAIAYVFYSQVDSLTSGSKSYLFHVFGGLIFLGFGIVTLVKKPKEAGAADKEMVNQTKDYLLLGLKGFFLNFANPAVIFYWLTVIALGKPTSSDKSDMGDNILLYIAILLVTFFSLDVLKILGAKKLRPFITDTVLTMLNRLTGLIILSAGVYMIIKGLIAWVQ